MMHPIRKGKIALVFGLAILIVALSFFPRPVRNIFFTFSAPLQKSLWGAGNRVSGFFRLIGEAQKSAEETQQLRAENQKLIARIVQLQALGEENRILREAMGLGIEKELKVLFAQIVGKDISSDSILLDKGSKDGVAVGSPVLTEEKVVCGKISEVYNDFSKAELISDKNVSFDVKILPSDVFDAQQTSTGVSALIKGQGGTMLLIELIPKEAVIRKDDVVVTSALGRVFPANLLVGKIKKVINPDVEPFQQAEVKMGCDIKKTEQLFITKEY